MCFTLSFQTTGSRLCFPFIVKQDYSTFHILYISVLLITALCFKVAIIYMYREIYITIKNSDNISKTSTLRHTTKSVVFIRRASCVLSIEFTSWLLSLCVVFYNVLASDLSTHGIVIIQIMIYIISYAHNVLYLFPRLTECAFSLYHASI